MGEPVAIGGFSLQRQRSKSRVGTLHLAEDGEGRLALLRLVATDLSEDARKRVDTDLNILEEVACPNIVPLIAHGEEEGRTFYALADPGGSTLLDLVRGCRPLDSSELIWIGRGLAKGLAALHVVRLPHGNIVPANVLVTSARAYIVDLGWTPRLAAKDAQDSVSAESDLRALGELLCFAACGIRPPPAPKPFDVQKRIPWLSDELVGIIDALLGPPAKRPAAKDVFKQLEALATKRNLPISAPLPSLQALLLTLPDRSRNRTSGGSSTDARSESNWNLDGDAVLSPGSAILLRPGLELICERLLGQGGMGVVYLLRDPMLGRLAALKLVRGKNDTRIKRFLRETSVTARLDHPGIPPVYEAGRTPSGEDYLLMRYVEGSSLRELIDRVRSKGNAASEVRNLIAAMVKVGEALGYAHSRGIVHRDLKPDNIMVGAFGEVFLMDWGLVRNLGESAQEDAVIQGEFATPVRETARQKLTHDGAFLGTPGYMAPEQFRREEVDGRADVFAMGAILSEILTGRHPFSSESTVELLAQTNEGHVELPCERDPKIAPELNAIVGKALSGNKAYRYTSADALVSDLKAYLEGREVSVYTPSASRQLVRLLRRHSLFFGSQAVVLLLLIAVGIFVTKVTVEKDAALAEGQAATREATAREEAEQAKRRVEINGLIAAGQQALADGDPEMAKEYFAQVQILDPTNRDAKIGKRQSEDLLAVEQTEGRLQENIGEATRRVAAADEALAKGDLTAARRGYLQALGFDGKNAEAQKGLVEVDRRRRERTDSERRDARNTAAKKLLREARAEIQSCHDQIQRQEDPQEIQDGYMRALAKLEKAIRVARTSYPAAEKLRVTAAHELYAILSAEGQEELADFVLRFKELEPPPAGAIKLERDPHLIVVEAERVKIRRAFPGAVHFKPTTVFDGMRDYLRRLGKGRFRVTIEVRSKLTDSIPPNILATGLWVRLEDRQANSVSPPLKIDFEQTFRRMVRIDRQRRIVSPFDQSRPAEAKRYVLEVEERVKVMMKEAINRNR